MYIFARASIQALELKPLNPRTTQFEKMGSFSCCHAIMMGVYLDPPM